MSRYNDRYNQRLIDAFYKAALFLVERIQHDGWVWSSNYLREHVRCATGLKFSNSISPEILRELRKYPNLRPWIEIAPLKENEAQKTRQWPIESLR
jgi:hypothetical protein